MSTYSRIKETATDVEYEEVPSPAAADNELRVFLYLTKEQIESALLSNGFTKDSDDHYLKVEQVVKQRMIINGQDVSKKEEVRIEISYLGEGNIFDEATNFQVLTHGLSLIINGNQVSDFWVSRLSDLKEYFNLIIEDNET